MTNDELEKRILEKLKKEVFEKDNQLKQHQEDEDVRSATKEALAEMTSLDSDEVEELYKKIKKEELIKLAAEQASQQRKKSIIIALVLLLAGVGGYIGFQYLKPKPTLFVLEEKFDVSPSILTDEDAFVYERRIENNQFVHDAQATGNWCYWNSSPRIEFPQNYTLTTKTEWKNGSQAWTYGILLIDQNGEYISFAISQEGKTNISVRQNEEYTYNKWDYDQFDKQTKVHTIQAVVRGDVFEMYVDDTFVRRDKLPNLKFAYCGLRVCDMQTVGFDDVVVTNDDTKEVVFKEDFNTVSDQKNIDWDVEKNAKYEFKTENGRFVMNNIQKDYCNRSEAFLPDNRTDKEWELSVDATWKNGTYPKKYGLMAVTVANEAIELLIENNGDGQYLLVDSEFKEIDKSGVFKTNTISKGNETVNLKIIKKADGKADFLVNGRKVHQQDIPIDGIQKIGLLVCGEQLVEFDNLIYKQIE